MILAVIGLFALQTSGTPPGSIDVSSLKVAAPTPIVELDLGKLKGELRQVGWSPDGSKLYIQTADGPAQSPKLRHYWVAIEGGAVLGIDAQPDWANVYWAHKSDRMAPGIGSLMIDVEQKFETLKYGTGSAGAADGVGADRAGGNTVMSANNIDREAQRQAQHVVRLTLLNETVSEFVNQAPIPGLMFSWGPSGTGAIAYTDRELGHLMLLDRTKHKQTINGIKDAVLPAWSLDGSRLAWAQKTGRKKYTLVYANVTR